MVPTENTAKDEAARIDITTDLDSTLFVEAGAGSGKTTALVRRVGAVLETGVAMENIAAITFTEKAANELRNRLREELSKSNANPEALDQLDGAAITTLHGFALRILSHHAIEAGLPPRLEVSPLDAFEDRWGESLDRLLYSPDQENALVLALILGIQVNHLRDLALALDNNWDIVEDRMVDKAPIGPVEMPDLGDLVTQMQRVASLADYCLDPADKMLARLREVEGFAVRLAEALHDDVEATRILNGPTPSFRAGRLGKKDNWPDDFSVDEVRDRVRGLEPLVEDAKLRIADSVIERLARVLGQFTLEAANDRKSRGVLEYHDLLVLARNLLRDPRHGAEVRTALAKRYQRLLLDEFQDTDPIQIELAKLIATSPEDTGEWADLQDEPGRLFYVGDPKQSIYRFRRANIEMYTKASEAKSINHKSLTRNFRSVEPILTWINGLFQGFMAPTRPDDLYVQPPYQALDPVRGSPPEGPAVSVLGEAEHAPGTLMGQLREVEAKEVAQAILTAIGQGWSVGDGEDERKRERWREARLEDICVLLPTRTSLPQLEQALEEYRIPYRIEAGSLIWASQAIREVMHAIRSLADPTDEVALVNALRSPAFGCGDDNLFTYKTIYHGQWNFTAALPHGLPDDHPVGEAMAWLADFHADVRWLNPSQLIERLVRERQLLETGCFGLRRPRDVWRSLQVLIDQARQFEEAGGRGLREFVAWADRKIDDQVRESDIILSETDDDAVRITTIHAAKGREFPIVILSGTHAKPRPMSANLIWPGKSGFGVRFKSSLMTETFADHEKRELQMDRAEKVRLLYVALTRAKDHLVVSTHRQQRGTSDSEDPSMAEMVADNAAELPEYEWEDTLLAPGSPTPNALWSLLDWLNERESALKSAAIPLVVGASYIASLSASDGNSESDPGLVKDGPTDGDDLRAPWKKGRYGTKVGIAVHGVLQTVELNTDLNRLDSIAATQAEAEGVYSEKNTVRDLAESALASETVQEAADADHWKEVFLATSVGDTVVEGYVDLLYRSSEGLVVVDYKTDDVHYEPEFNAKVDRYRLQVAALKSACQLTANCLDFGQFGHGLAGSEGGAGDFEVVGVGDADPGFVGGNHADGECALLHF